MVTVVIDDGETAVAGAEATGDALWLPARDAEAVTGWVRKPEGLCRGETCVPLPRGREAELVRDGAAGSALNVAGLWRLLGRPVARSARGDAWVLGASTGERAQALRSLEAPDFALPDPGGKLHRLSDHRGKKVLLVTWASW
jgi:hypothetical protein